MKRLTVLASIGLAFTLVLTGRAPATTAAVPSQRIAPAAAKPVLRLTSLDPWVQPVDTVTATVDVTGAPPGSTLTSTLHGAVATRSAFALTMNEKSAGPVLERFAPHPLAGATDKVVLHFAVGDGTSPLPDGNAVTLTRPGVYPLEFSLQAPDQTNVISTVAYVVRLPAASLQGPSGRNPLRVASELRLQPRPATDTRGDLDTDAMATPDVDALVEELANVPTAVRASFGFAVSPALIDALDRSGHDTTVDRLSSLIVGLPVQPQPWSPLDLGSWLATDDLLGRLSLLVGRGNRTLSNNLHAPDPTTTDVGAWSGPVSDATLGWFLGQGATGFLVPESDLEPLDANAFPRTLAAPFELDLGQGRPAKAMQIDRALSAHFLSTDPVLGANRLIADLSVIALDLPGLSRGTVVAPPPGHDVSAAFLRAYSGALASAHPTGTEPLLVALPVQDVVAGTPTARAGGDSRTSGDVLVRKLRSTDPARPLSELGSQLALTDALVISLKTMEPGGVTAASRRTSALQERMDLASMPGIPTAVRNRRFAGVRAEVASAARSVVLPPRQTITLTSNSASIPLTIRRTAAGPRRVVVHIDVPDRLRLPDGDTQAVRLTATTTRINIRVHSDAPGDTLVRLAVTSPDGRLMAASTQLVVRSTAASGVGLIISLGSLIFLVLWWGRDIVRSRRRRRAAHIPPAELIDIVADDQADV